MILLLRRLQIFIYNFECFEKKTFKSSSSSDKSFVLVILKWDKQQELWEASPWEYQLTASNTVIDRV